MSFFKKSAIKTTAEIIEKCAPQVVISKDALAKMQIYVEECSDEVGWLGTAQREGNIVFITDVMLFDQEVHATTTEITPEGLSDFAEEILEKEDGMEIWNSIKVWGHSHVNMATSPSGQDNSQMITFADTGHDWFIRIIANKKGDIRVDLYDYSIGVIYNNIGWQEHKTKEELEILNFIQQLEEKLISIQQSKKEEHEKEIKEEMKTKVRKKTYTTIRTTGYGQTGYNRYGSGYGGYSVYGGWDTVDYDKETQQITTKEKKNNKTDGVLEKKLKLQENGIYKSELLDMGMSKSVDEVENYLDDLGLKGVYSKEEIQQIWILAEEELQEHWCGGYF